ncbi:beta-glucosidase 31-like [Zingiber officinale]|uniref:beta-glucosidase 31-like n=1 Tax=Zingiber officinale TaxID=94328 RepID=UPI001C4B1DD9|nr:beta-glucosidase 31-like [Zingiber officinale]
MERRCIRWRPPALIWVLLIVLVAVAAPAIAISRDDFPSGFIFGAGSSAYQVEGAAAEGGRSPCIWDTFAHEGRTEDKRTGDIAADQYHKYKEDVKLMHDMGLDAYRFSISWSRVIPNGRGPVNPEGVQYYNNLINELKKYGIEPHVTLLHFDLPQSLEDEYSGLLSPKIVEDFTAYADVCFREFGDRVKYWITVNEPNIEPILGHDLGIFPPNHCSSSLASSLGLNCSKGNSSVEPYVAGHNLLLSHASAVSLYRKKYQPNQGGYIGITLLGIWFEPATRLPDDIAAVNRALDFLIGWFANPIVYGRYPSVMQKLVGSRLPSFKSEESTMLRGSFDFIGLNHYSLAFLRAATDNPDDDFRDWYTDMSVSFAFPQTKVTKVFVSEDPPITPSTPWAMQRLLDYMRNKYGNPPVFIHENGYPEYNIDPATCGHEYYDEHRANYIKDYIESMLLPIRNGSNVNGYFVWSFMDSFEVVTGYRSRYGLIGVDYSVENRTRYRRYSADWYSKFLKPNGGFTVRYGDVNVE